MYLVLKNPAMATFSGYMGMIEFENGISIDHVSKRDHMRFSTITDVGIIEEKPTLTLNEVNGDEFLVEASGYGVKYEWFCEDERIMQDSKGHFVASDDRLYSCVVSNPMGSLEPILFKREADKKTAKVETKSEPEKTVDDSKGEPLFERAALEGIADKKGIAGLRDLAAEYGIKGRSISEIIEEMLELTA